MVTYLSVRSNIFVLFSLILFNKRVFFIFIIVFSYSSSVADATFCGLNIFSVSSQIKPGPGLDKSCP